MSMYADITMARFWKIVSYAGAMAWVQVINIATGLWIVHALPVEKYAIFTVLVSGVAGIKLLGNGGTISALTSIAGRHFGSAPAVVAAFRHVRQLQTRIFLVMAVVSLPTLMFLLMSVGAGLWEAMGGALGAFGMAAVLAAADLHRVLLRLKGRTRRIQRLDLGAALARMAFVAVVTQVVADPTVVLMLAVPGLIWQYGAMRLDNAPLLREAGTLPAEEHGAAGRVVRRALPNNLYFVFSGQISIWLLAIFGSGAAVASLGALSRFLMLRFIFVRLVQDILAPYFAKQPDGAASRRVFLASLLVVVVVPLLFIVAAYMVPDWLLFILGPKYAGLHLELQMIAWALAIQILATATSGLLAARGWWMNPMVTIASGVGGYVVGIAIFDVSTLTGVLLLGILASSVSMVVLSAFAAMRFLRTEKTATSPAA